ncbi:MAG: DUF805 domain-containing protein [Pseudomonadota bacterium]
MHWMILPFKRYFDFEGRSRRMEYWMFILLNTAVALLLTGPVLFAAFGVAMDPELSAAGDEVVGEVILASMSGFGGLSLGLYGLFALFAFIPSIAVTVRRLHDRDMSGWWYLGFTLAGILPLVGLIASLVFLVLLLLPGTSGSNRFGPDPKNPYNQDVFA